MPRQYKKQEGGKHYVKHTPESLNAAIVDVMKGMTYRNAAKKYKINYSVLHRRSKKIVKNQGGQPVLSENEEKEIMLRLIQCADWGYPVESFDLRMIVKAFLDHAGRRESRFNDNMPGKEWAYSFLKRHKTDISERMCQNIKRARAKVSPQVVEQYFEYLEKEIEGVPASNIINYDETNLSDDPGKRKVITKRGCKYPERIMNHSKSATSIMFAASADGVLLPCYVVYKATNLYNTWTENGPKHTRYNRSKSGWFDGTCFEDWVRTVVIPHCSKLEGRKLLIGDNLSSHLSCEMVRLCKEHNISFVFLPPNSTHLTQPLDIAYFRPMKIKWRQILTTWKKRPGRKETCVPKDVFPRLLSRLYKEIEVNSAQNIESGFKKAGIFPLNKNEVLKMIPKQTDPDQQDRTRVEICDVFVEFMKNMRYGDEEETVRKRKKKVNVKAGKSVSVEDFENISNGNRENEDVENEDLMEENAEIEPIDRHYSVSKEPISDSDEHVSDDGESTDGQLDLEPLEPVVCEKNFDENVVNDDTGERVTINSVDVGSWLIVHFPRNISRPSTSKDFGGKNFIGLVEKVCTGGDTFVGKFLRPKSTRDFSGFIYGFPDVPDEGLFSVHQIKTVLNPPESYGRGYLKFEIQSKDLNS